MLTKTSGLSTLHLSKKGEGLNKKLAVILGPTSSGKTDLSIKLAKRFNAEIVSADSRQVYKKMNLGTGKITKKEMQGIPHYLLDVASPKKIFTVVQYRKLAKKALKKIWRKGKIPFLVGGTGFYIQSVTDGISIPEVKPDWKLRKKLEKIAVSRLYEKLKKLDPKRASHIDKNNPRRLIRALEIVLKTKRPIPPLLPKNPDFDVIFLGLKKDPKKLKKLIEKRLIKRLESGMVTEVKNLQKSEVSFKRLEEFGLEYRYIALYLQNKITYEKMIEKLKKEIEHYAKRQMTWFKRDERINWIENYNKAEKLIKKFIKN